MPLSTFIRKPPSAWFARNLTATSGMTSSARPGSLRSDCGMSELLPPLYVCGHSANELERLEIQGAFFEEITRNLLVAAGIGPGMRVLDIGCGAGDVSLLAADLVG